MKSFIFISLFFIFTGCSHQVIEKEEQIGEVEKLNKMATEGEELMRLAALCYLGEFSKAFEMMDQLFISKEKDPAYWNQVGNCYFLQGDPLLAKFYYKEALKLDANFKPTTQNIANLSI